MTTSSYAVLGLLALRPWSAYDLARQAERSLRFAWPTSERHLYTEPKKLVALGYATMREEPIGPERTRKVYEISPSGREALASWTETAPAPPTFEAETMVRLLFAENGGIDHLRHALEKLSDDTRTLHSWSLDIIDGYVSGDDIPFPAYYFVSSPLNEILTLPCSFHSSFPSSLRANYFSLFHPIFLPLHQHPASTSTSFHLFQRQMDLFFIMLFFCFIVYRTLSVSYCFLFVLYFPLGRVIFC